MIPDPGIPDRDPARRTPLRWAIPVATAVAFTIALVGLVRSRTQPSAAVSDPSSQETLPNATAPSATAVAVPGQAPIMRATASPEVAELRQDLEALIPEWTSAEWSILIVSLDRGDTLFSEAPDLALTPASNMKLVTTAAAFRHLGADFRFRTMALGDGNVQNGRLQGDLILLGTGDPGLSDRMYDANTSVFEQLANQLSDAGIVSVEGNIVGDGSYFAGPLLGPEWQDEDLNEWFAAPVSGLTFNENIVTLQISPSGSVGRAPLVTEVPSGAGLKYNNNAETVSGRPRPRLWLERLAPSAIIRMEGDIQSSGNTIWRRLTVADPVLFAARAFRDVLLARGIAVGGEAVARGARPLRGPGIFAPRRSLDAPGAAVLAAVESPPLLDYLTVVNHVSHNLFAEAVFKSVGRVARGDGSFQGGARAVIDYLDHDVGVRPGTVDVRDGSGLSPSNTMTAGAFISILQYVARSDDWDEFERTLPLAGRQRGLRRMYRTRAAGNLRAKTGTIDGVSSLTGIVRSATGERLLFSIISNGVRSTNAAKRVEDRMAVRLAEFRRPDVPVAETSPAG